ncbi:MAG: FecR domain-containing protein [Candidatus Omnitrophica bacterium]|nr:FecR domain-containing protein [Candidatus Omnitrophota bacterium]MCK5492721.1 FecR domain-containing protein [Candidatus Omnitrophota bacterium]
MRNKTLKSLFYLSAILMLFSIVVCHTVFAQGEQNIKKNFMTSIADDIEKTKNDLSKQIEIIEGNIQGAKNLISQAQKESNKEAEDIGSQALSIAVAAKEKAFQEKSELEKTIKNIRKRLSKLADSDFPINSVVTGYSGEVSYYSKKLGKEVSLSKNPITYLESGDRIITGKNGNVQIYCFEGSGKVEIGENTILGMKNDDGVLDLISGQINLKVKKIKKKIKEYLDNHPYMVRTPTAAIAIRGTEFAVFVDKSKATDIFVFEGSVEVIDVNDKDEKNIVIVNEGYQVHVTGQGQIKDVNSIDI